MKRLLSILFFLIAAIIGCNKNDNIREYSVLNSLINSRSQSILDNKFYIENKTDYNFDTSKISRYLDLVKELTPEDKRFMMSQILDKSNKRFEENYFTNKNIQLVNNFKPTSNDYYLKFSRPIFSKDYKYSFIREYAYYWGKDTVTFYLMHKDSTGWNIYLMNDWKLIKK